MMTAGWRIPFTIIAIPTLVCAALVRLLLSDPRTQQKAGHGLEAEINAEIRAKQEAKHFKHRDYT